MKQVPYGTVAFYALLMLAPVASAEDLAGIQARGTLRIGVSMFAPWTLESRDGELEGFEIEVGRRVAQAMGVELAPNDVRQLVRRRLTIPSGAGLVVRANQPLPGVAAKQAVPLEAS